MGSKALFQRFPPVDTYATEAGAYTAGVNGGVALIEGGKAV